LLCPQIVNPSASPTCVKRCDGQSCRIRADLIREQLGFAPLFAWEHAPSRMREHSEASVISDPSDTVFDNIRTLLGKVSSELLGLLSRGVDDPPSFAQTVENDVIHRE